MEHRTKQPHIGDERMPFRKDDRAQEDSQILDLLFARSEAGLEQLAAKYGRACMQIARGVLNSEQDAEECVNDAYLKIWNAIPPHRPDSLLSYTLTVVRRLALNRWHHNRTDKQAAAEACIPLSELEEHLSEVSLPDGDALRELLSDFLDSLSEKDEILFVRRYWYLDSVRTLSEMSGYSENNVYQRLYVIRRKLVKRLQKEGYHYEE